MNFFRGLMRQSPLVLLFAVNGLQLWRKLKAVRDQSRLLSGLILTFVFCYLALAFWLFRMGLKFLSSFPGLGIVLTERLLFLLFAFLFALLLLSNLVISYTNLFRNRETRFLLSLPVRPQTIFRWKFFETTLLASWAFLFLIAPLLAAFGLTYHVPWHFYALTVVLVGLFIVLPAVAGAWLAINLARYMDRKIFQVLGFGVAVIFLTAAAFWLKPEPMSEEMMETRVLAVLDQMLVKTRFAQFPLLPSYWLSMSVLQWAEGALVTAGFFMLVLLSNCLFFGSLAFGFMGNMFYEASSTSQSRESVFGEWEWFRSWRNKKGLFYYAPGLAEKLFQQFRWLRTDTRALILKDTRIFWRDTTQWGQTLMLFGLLGIYIINLRHFSHQLTQPFWVHLVSFLNLGACSLNLATLTTRFVYPQFSLEGKRLWIVGLAPLGLVKVLRVKYWMASVSSLTVTLGLIVLSCYMLKIPWERTLFFGAAITIMTFTLNGLAIGLGALYPNFKEENPSKIVSGFGGTFCLVLSFLYIVASVALLAIGSPWSRVSMQSPWILAACWGAFAALSILLGRLPLHFAIKRVERFEF